MREQACDSARVRRFGGGSRVRTEKVSKAAWPLSPQLRSPMAFLVA